MKKGYKKRDPHRLQGHVGRLSCHDARQIVMFFHVSLRNVTEAMRRPASCWASVQRAAAASETTCSNILSANSVSLLHLELFFGVLVAGKTEQHGTKRNRTGIF
ncbi:MAG TPA: hypothetical protein VKM55_01730 [Candidatus Lokiarchaeia archaeon]|nr:hypothetical protein [Candidatus Lokiarchaeia archaeon]